MGLYTCKSVQSLPNMIINVYLWGPFLALNLPVYIALKGLQIYLVHVYVKSEVQRMKTLVIEFHANV